MKKILVINPNSSIKMTEDIKATVEDLPKDEFEIDVIYMRNAPTVLESFQDYTLAGAEILKFLKTYNLNLYSGILLACFGDPCLFAIKEAVDIPVIGIAEASFSRALLLGYRFSVIAASDKAVPMMESLIDSYCLQERNAGTMTLQTNIEAFLDNPVLLKEKLLDSIHRAKEKRAEVLILGCAGMTMVSKEELEEETGVEIINPIITGISTLKAIVLDNDSISKIGLYQ